MIAGTILLAQTTAGQSPAVSTAYANEEIARMIEQYKRANAQDVLPWRELMEKFQSDFPQAYGVEWETAAGIFEADFDVKSKDCKAYYDSQCNLLMIVEEFSRAQLPSAVVNAVVKKYPRHRFEDIDRIRVGTDILYKIEIESAEDAELTLLLNQQGEMLEQKLKIGN
jgi:hypothetical protein